MRSPIVENELSQVELEQLYEKILREMDSQGDVEHLPAFEGLIPEDWQPIVIDGEPLSETIIRLRGDR